MAGKRGITGRGLGWEILHSWWVLFSFFILSWVGFFLIGAKAKKKKWIWLGVVFCVLQFGILFPFAEAEGALSDVLMMIWIAAYVAGIILTFRARKEYLICRDVLLNARVGEKDDQRLREAVVHSYRQQGVQNARTTAGPVEAAPAQAPVPPVQPAPQPAVQASAPVRPAAPLDLNACSELELTQLPGVSAALAKRAAAYRAEHGGFSSMEEFIAALELKPHFAAQLEGKAFCGAFTPPASQSVPAETSPQVEKRGRKLDF